MLCRYYPLLLLSVTLWEAQPFPKLLLVSESAVARGRLICLLFLALFAFFRSLYLTLGHFSIYLPDLPVIFTVTVSTVSTVSRSCKFRAW